MKPVLEAALNLAEQGYPVFPVGRDKRPRCPRGHLAAATDPAVVRAMAAQFGFVLIGVVTGAASGAMVLDIDRQHGGGKWFSENRHRLPATRIHRTRSGGLHIWLAHRNGLRSSTSRIAPGVDIRGEGGSCIWWPAAGLPVLSSVSLAPWPDWLIPSSGLAPAPVIREDGPRPAAIAEAALAGLVRTIATAAPGTRNARLFWSACRVAEMVDRGEVSQSFAEAVLLEAGSRAGLEMTECQSTILSARRRAAA